MTPSQRMNRTLKRAIKADGRSLYAIARAAKLHYSIPNKFMLADQLDITLNTIASLCDVLGLELAPKNRKG